jgi:hypothetical protein
LPVFYLAAEKFNLTLDGTKAICMKRHTLLLLCISITYSAIAQLNISIGVKGGLNFANIADASDINSSSKTGYMLGGYIGPKKRNGFGFRSEFILSRQGYNYKTNTNTGNVSLDYLLLPQLFTLNFTKLVQLHAGGQAAILLNADVDSTGGNSNGSLLEYFNRFDYGIVGGAEISPLLGFFVGARLNISLSAANKNASANWPNFIPKVDARNNVVQLYAGWRF